jgi:hypothetical protein
MASTGGDKLAESEQLLIQGLQTHKDGLSVKLLDSIIPLTTKTEQTELVNRILRSGNAELLTDEISGDTIIRYRKSKLPSTATQEDELVFRLL